MNLDQISESINSVSTLGCLISIFNNQSRDNQNCTKLNLILQNHF